MGRLKEDGAAGLLYAINANGEVVPARNGVSGEKYSCPVCNCSVHLRVTQSGKHFCSLPWQSAYGRKVHIIRGYAQEAYF